MHQFPRKKTFCFVQKPALWLVFLCLIFSPFASFAAMQSASYVIHESVMFAFDGPIISGISASVSGQTATITWTTDQLSDAFVEYSADSGFVASKEQGTSVQDSLNHTVAVTGLDPSAMYYFRVKSRRVNGGVTTNTPIGNSFTTDAAPVVDAGGGGGMIIIDKSDKVAPVITKMAVNIISDTETEITWETDESASAFAEYGLNTAYGSTYGTWATGTAHSLRLENLKAETTYHMRAISSDGWGNLGYSEDILFSTQAGMVNPDEEATTTPERPIIQEETNVLEETRRIVTDWIRRLFPEIPLGALSANPLADINSLDDLKRLAPMPVFLGEPRVEAGADKATVFWTTDIESTSQVALASEADFKAGADEPYIQIVGDAENTATAHAVTVYGLLPNTTYHFQLRGKPRLGNMARSRDFTFNTMLEELAITSFFSQIIDDNTAVFKWVTNKQSNSSVTIAPYINGALAIDMAKTVRNSTETVIHEITIADFIGGTVYSVTLLSEDTAGNRAIETLNDFSTAPDDAPPSVTNLKADSTVFLDRDNKTQTIISWLTNEPSTSRLYYQEGVFGEGVELKEQTALNENYTKEHVMVVTKFKPGVVYTFRVESIDSGSNKTLSAPHTFMTAKKKDSIFQVIMNILENTFGWMKKVI